MTGARKVLDALALVTLSDDALIKRIAALWCREFDTIFPTTKLDVVKWAKQEFGPIIDPDREGVFTHQLAEEAKRQVRLRLRRRKRKLPEDVLATPAGSTARIGALLNSRLGPAHLWAGKYGGRYRDNEYAYIDATFYSGIIAGLIPIEMRLRRVENPNLLVYRRGFGEPRSYWIPGHILSVLQAFVWLIPEEATGFLQLEGCRVEHDGDAQAVRLITPFGTKLLPWRQLLPTENAR